MEDTICPILTTSFLTSSRAGDDLGIFELVVRLRKKIVLAEYQVGVGVLCDLFVFLCIKLMELDSWSSTSIAPFFICFYLFDDRLVQVFPLVCFVSFHLRSPAPPPRPTSSVLKIRPSSSVQNPDAAVLLSRDQEVVAVDHGDRSRALLHSLCFKLLPLTGTGVQVFFPVDERRHFVELPGFSAGVGVGVSITRLAGCSNEI